MSYSVTRSLPLLLLFGSVMVWWQEKSLRLSAWRRLAAHYRFVLWFIFVLIVGEDLVHYFFRANDQRATYCVAWMVLVCPGAALLLTKWSPPDHRLR